MSHLSSPLSLFHNPIWVCFLQNQMPPGVFRKPKSGPSLKRSNTAPTLEEKYRFPPLSLSNYFPSRRNTCTCQKKIRRYKMIGAPSLPPQTSSSLRKTLPGLRNGVPRTHTTHIYFLTVLVTRSPRSRCPWGWFFLKPMRETRFLASLSASSGPWPSLGVLGL